MELNQCFNCDNEEILKQLPDKSIQLFIEDMPYNSTPCNFEYDVDLEKYWNLRKNKITDNGCYVLFGQEPFSSFVRMSNIKEYKYDWYWMKERPTNIFQVKRRPGKNIECISIFYKEQCIYNPQKSKHDGKLVKNKVNGSFGLVVGKSKSGKPNEYRDDRTRYPLQLLKYNRDNLNELIHPTQKPFELIKYLIKTYTNEGDLVFDGYAGSMTTAVACIDTNRNYICCEWDKEEGYFEKGMERIKNFKRTVVVNNFF